jgi:hypothetical protein
MSSGDLFNQNEFDASSVGISLVMIIDELIEFFFMNEKVLADMLNGTKPN